MPADRLPARGTPRGVAVLMTCHNRRERTLAAIASVYAQTGLPAGTRCTVHLVDAGSADGTADAVRAAFPATDVLTVGADVHWGTGTRIAATRADPAAHVLWLNDDVVLDPGALTALLDTAAPLDRPAVAVGAMRSGDGTRTTYSGYRLAPARHRPPALRRIEPDPGNAQPCDTCNGNAVLVTAAARRILGDLDPAFPHRLGDHDYGLRARRAGIPLLLAPGHVGTCDDNTHALAGTSAEPGLDVRTALKRLASVREQPPAPWWRYCRRHLGPWAPLVFCSPYVKTALRRRPGAWPQHPTAPLRADP
ncbi:glycosyltransferase family 2 protein [Streptomyces sp. ICN441]|uniref:Glucosyl transferase n=1 Tax=Streptomyces tirandamycinicus TaxID=2174846 RepID=A0A2S1SZN0_9ACTN|nr:MULTISPECIES: glycosyltransferase family 2 protein [Streptomyces]AWI31826.1 glucosyl transferase [Streptomyces tirandamycinicus]NNJ07236.1 glycosyltransferase family 2 protein [Streptomyces sp. PKU-MA01144]TFE49837.1 glycosyltransferase family 2 protein [Streptomyces sp. ICN441]